MRRMSLTYSKMEPKDFGQFLRYLRGNRTLREAAELSGLSYTYISIIEKGYKPGTDKPVKITPDALKKISTAYNHSYEDLLVKTGYIAGDMIMDQVGEDWLYRYRTIEESKDLSKKEAKINENDIEKLLLNNQYLSYNGVVLSIEDKLQILEMIPVLINRSR